MVAQSESHAALDLLLGNMRLMRWHAWRVYRDRDLYRASVDPDDIVQEAVILAMKQMPKFDPAKMTFEKWLGWQVINVARKLSSHLRERLGNAKMLGGTFTNRSGEEVDRFSMLADHKAEDPAEGTLLQRVLVPVEQVTVGACPTAWVRDVRTGQRVQVPHSDVIVWHGRLFAVAVSFDEGDDELHRVRFGNDHVAWVLAAVQK